MPTLDPMTFNEEYFNQDYKLQAIWLGLIWWFLSLIPSIIFAAWSPGYVWNGSYYYWGLTNGEWHAWHVMRYGFGTSFGALSIFWLIAYIKQGKNRILQKIYYRAIAWVIPLSWVFALWIFIAFLVGGSQYGGNMGRDVGMAFGFWIIVAGMEALAWFVAPRATKFYKWQEQDWWNYNTDDVPKTWPSQLGDFVDY